MKTKKDGKKIATCEIILYVLTNIVKVEQRASGKPNLTLVKSNTNLWRRQMASKSAAFFEIEGALKAQRHPARFAKA
jgi:hypothetical protein